VQKEESHYPIGWCPARLSDSRTRCVRKGRSTGSHGGTSRLRRLPKTPLLLRFGLNPDESRSRELVGGKEMTWPQYRDGGFNGRVAKSIVAACCQEMKLLLPVIRFSTAVTHRKPETATSRPEGRCNSRSKT